MSYLGTLYSKFERKLKTCGLNVNNEIIPANKQMKRNKSTERRF
jgi:hypothetical protein